MSVKRRDLFLKLQSTGAFLIKSTHEKVTIKEWLNLLDKVEPHGMIESVLHVRIARAAARDFCSPLNTIGSLSNDDGNASEQ